MSETGPRPDTVSKALWQAADYLDKADELVRLLKARKGETVEMGQAMQTDLRRLSRWFHTQPDCDAHALAYLVHFDDDTDGAA